MRTWLVSAHISERNLGLIHLVALGNHFSDRINWLIEALGKVSLTQTEISNEINLKLDLIDNTLIKVDEQIPVNFGEAFAQT